ncbi:MAG: WHG domain-containing protein, partial [Geodermatophilaceae bacterium]|nr:WHG domain-containing protein [Geodermatophilaceae bacterium]
MGDVNTEILGPLPTRRERARAQTRYEILAAARDLVRQGEEINMRAVGRAVGMTAPALYRYVDGHDDLLDLLGGSLYEELIDELTRARDLVDSADLIARLIAMAHAFRNWALAHRQEYGLLFASPLM